MILLYITVPTMNIYITSSLFKLESLDDYNDVDDDDDKIRMEIRNCWPKLQNLLHKTMKANVIRETKSDEKNMPLQVTVAVENM